MFHGPEGHRTSSNLPGNPGLFNLGELAGELCNHRWRVRCEIQPAAHQAHAKSEIQTPNPSTFKVSLTMPSAAPLECASSGRKNMPLPGCRAMKRMGHFDRIRIETAITRQSG